MLSKIRKIIISIALSFVVCVGTAMLCSLLGEYIVGSSSDSNGAVTLNGGPATGLTILAICIVVSVSFGIWFYKSVHLYKKSKTEETQK